MRVPCIKAIWGYACFCLLAVTGCTQTLRQEPHSEAVSSAYNHRLSLRMQRDRQHLVRNMTLTCDEAKVRGRKMCSTSKTLRCRLLFGSRRPFYRLTANGCYIDIDAIDGSVMRYENPKKGKV